MRLGQIFRYDPDRQKDAPDFSITEETRLRHIHVLGKTGVGKSTLLANMMAEDIREGRGFALFDPHGDLADTVLSLIPRHRCNDTILFDPADREFPVGFNVLARCPPDRRALVASFVVDAFFHIWKTSWGPQLEQILYNAVAALLDMPGGTLLGVKYLLTSENYRHRVISHIQDPVVRSFWEQDFEEHMPEREQRERTLSTLNKIGQLIADPMLRNIIAQPENRIDFPSLMDGGIFVANLSQGHMGSRKSALLGALLLASFHAAALQRQARRPFHIVVDEFHNFGAASFIEMLSGIRKYGVSLTLCHQYLDQLSPEMKAAILGTVGTSIAFKIGATDASVLAPEFTLKAEDFTSLRPFAAHVRSGDKTHLLHMSGLTTSNVPSSPSRIRQRMHNQFTTGRPAAEDRIRRFIAGT